MEWKECKCCNWRGYTEVCEICEWRWGIAKITWEAISWEACPNWCPQPTVKL